RRRELKALPGEEIIFRIILVSPATNVRFAIQRGREELTFEVESTGGNLSFDVPVRVKSGRDGSPDFAGPFVQGPPGGRFVYVNSGKRAGDAASCWDRRAKVSLAAI